MSFPSQKGKGSAPIPGTIGADPDMRTYADYLVKRYIDWKKRSDDFLVEQGRPPKSLFRPAATHRILGREFGSGSSVYQIPQGRFFDWVAKTQLRIDQTLFGKKNRHRNYSSWDEHLVKRHG